MKKQFIYKTLSDLLGSPCEYGLNDMCVYEIMPEKYCRRFCPDDETGYALCWKKFFEIMENKANE